MKIGVVLSLVFLLIIQSVGTQVLFHVQRGRIRHEIKLRLKNGVPQQELKSFKLAKEKGLNPDFYWLNDHEFRFKNEMFDVVKRSNIGSDSVLLQCVSDSQENALFVNLNAQLKNEWNAPSNKENEKTVQLAFAYEYLFVYDLLLVQRDFYSVFTLQSIENALQDGVASTPFTPPKTLFT